MVSAVVEHLKALVADISGRKLGFHLRTVHVGFVVDRVVLGQIYLRVFRFNPLSNIQDRSVVISSSIENAV